MRRYEKQEILTALSGIAFGLLIAMFVLTVLFLMGGCMGHKTKRAKGNGSVDGESL